MRPTVDAPPARFRRCRTKLVQVFTRAFSAASRPPAENRRDRIPSRPKERHDRDSNVRMKIAAGATVLGLGGLGRLRARVQRRPAPRGLGQTAARQVKPKVHTQVVHRTIHVRPEGPSEAPSRPRAGGGRGPGGARPAAAGSRARPYTGPGAGRDAGQRHVVYSAPTHTGSERRHRASSGGRRRAHASATTALERGGSGSGAARYEGDDGASREREPRSGDAAYRSKPRHAADRLLASRLLRCRCSSSWRSSSTPATTRRSATALAANVRRPRRRPAVVNRRVVKTKVVHLPPRSTSSGAPVAGVEPGAAAPRHRPPRRRPRRRRRLPPPRPPRRVARSHLDLMSSADVDIPRDGLGDPADRRRRRARRRRSRSTRSPRRSAFIEEFEQCLSRFRPDSELCALNADSRDVVPASRAAPRRGPRRRRCGGRATGGLVDPTLVGEIEGAGYAESREGADAAPTCATALLMAPERRPARAEPGAALGDDRGRRGRPA